MLKPLRIVLWRLRHHGLRVTLYWLYARGVPRFTGIPHKRSSEITPNVYVGGQYNHRGKAWLEANQIHACVNMRIEVDDAERGLDLREYLYLPTVDDEAPTMEQLQEGITFCQRIIDAGGTVYIHCKGGIGRAPTMAAAYFISTGLSLDEALMRIRKKRPFIKVMPPQMARLQELEAHISKQKA